MALDTNVVHTDLNYLIPDGFESAPNSVTVRDARRMPRESWQTLGFELFHFPSVVKSWDDDNAIAQGVAATTTAAPACASTVGTPMNMVWRGRTCRSSLSR